MNGMTVGDLYDRSVQAFGDRVALRQGGVSHTYGELRRHAARLAQGFQALGLQHGDHVAFLMVNCPEYVFVEYALARLGAVRIPLAVLLAADDHIYMMNHGEAKALVYHWSMRERVVAMAPELQHVRHFVCVGAEGELPEGHLRLEELEAGREDVFPHVQVSAGDLCGLYYTGGTTGRPKGVMLSHRAWVAAVTLETLELGFGYGEVFAFCTPMTHAAGVLLLPVLLRGGTAIILDHFDPAGLLETIEAERVTATMLVPTMIYRLLDEPPSSRDLRSLRLVLYGAAAIAPGRLEEAINRFGPVFAQYYGQTEAPMIITALPREEHDPARLPSVLSSCGRATLGTFVRLVDSSGREVAQGEVGEIVASCPHVMDGYWRDPATTADTLRDGWLHTGDLARQDERGYLYIVDRVKDMIVSGGYNIYPREVEDALFSHPAVQAAAVVGVPDDRWGEAVKAIVVLREGMQASAEELIAHVKRERGSLRAPKSVDFSTEIPLTNLGKPDRKRIRQGFWAGRERQV